MQIVFASLETCEVYVKVDPRSNLNPRSRAFDRAERKAENANQAAIMVPF
jgi:hypothetical protein